MRPFGDLPLPLSIERQTSAPLDATTYVPTLNNMLNHDNPGLLYKNVIVTVHSDPNPLNNGVYILKTTADRSNIENWARIADASTIAPIVNSQVETALQSPIRTFISGQDFTAFTGNQIVVTEDFIPSVHRNVLVYVNGSLLQLTSDYTIQDNTITLSTWRNNAKVSVIWFVSEEDFTNRPPSANSNLTVSLKGTRSVKVTWTSGGGFSVSSKPTRYIVYYAQFPITQQTYKSANSTIVSLEVMGGNGDQVSSIISGLEPKTNYYIAVTSERIDGATIRESVISNVASFTTKSEFAPVPTATLLPVLPYNVIDWHRRYHRDAETNAFIDQTINAFDGDTLLDALGNPSLESNTNKIFRASSTAYHTWDNYRPLQVVMDLGEPCRVDRVYMNIGIGNYDPYQLSTSLDGWNWSEFATASNPPFNDRNKFLRYDVPLQMKEARYIKLSHGPMSINEIVVMGSRLSDSLPSGTKLVSESEQLPAYEAFASNTFLNDWVEDWAKFGAIHRIYSNWSWYLPSDTITNPYVRLTPEDAALVPNGNGKAISYLFEGNRIHGNTDTRLELVKQLNLEYYGIEETKTFLNVKNLPPFLKLPLDGFDPTDPQLNYNPQSSGSWKAQDTAMYPDRTDKTDPMTYRFAAQCCFVFCARYGRTTGHPEELLRLHPSETPKQGLDLVKYFQFWNEPNLTWEGPRGYTNPYEFAALMSACYDGHKGELGPGMGAKAGDPTMEFVMPGLTGLYPDYIRAAMLWWDTFRGEGDYPIDVLSFHYYHNTVGGQGINEGRAGLTPDLPSPNGEFYDNMLPVSKDLRDRWFPGKQWWLSETGYDEGIKSLQASRIGGAVHTHPRTIGVLKGEWIVKSIFHALGAGCQKVDHYMYRNGAPLEELNANGFTNTYQSSGYVDLTPSGGGMGYQANPSAFYPKLESYYIVRASMEALGSRKMSHRVSFREIEDVPGVIIKDSQNELHSSIIAYGFKNHEQPSGKNCLVVWLGTVDDSITNVEIVVTEPSVDVLSIRNVSEAQSEVGVVSNIPATLNPQNGLNTITIQVSETPTFIYTDNIGQKPIKAAYLKGVPSSSTSIRLYWDDSNPAHYWARVFQYNEVTEEYNLIHDGETTNAKFDVLNLEPETRYSFIIQFYDITTLQESVFSNQVSIRTNKTIQAPSNVQQLSISFDRITLQWEYPLEEQANISAFRIERSLTPTSNYSIIASVGPDSRTFTNIGLLEDTTYYYRVQAISSAGESLKTAAVGITTSEAVLTAPLPVRAETDYFGNYVYIGFDLPVKQVGDTASAFTVFDGTQFKFVDTTEVDQNGTRLVLKLSEPILTSGNPINIVVGYESNTFLTSLLDVPVEDFSNYVVLNNIGNQDLVSAKIGVNLTTTAERVPEELNWNDIVGPLTDQSVYLPNAVDMITGNPTDYSFIMPNFNSTQRRNIVSLVNTQTRSFTGTDFSIIPEKAKQSVMNFNSTAPLSGRMVAGFLNLKQDKIYRLDVFSSRGSDSVVRDTSFILNEDLNTEQQLNITNNADEVITFFGVRASNPILQFDDDPELIPDASLPKALVTINMANERNGTGLNAIVLTEVQDINFFN